MALKDFIEALPADKQEAYKKEIADNDAILAKAVKVESVEDARKLVISNDFFKRANQSELDERDKLRVEKFETERLPKLVEEAKKKGEKSPLELEVEAMKADNLKAKKDLLIEKQRTKALAKANELGIPTALIDKYVGETDEETEAGIKFLQDTILPFKKAAIDEALKKVGSQTQPKGGDQSGPVDIAGKYAEAEKAGNADLMMALKEQMQAQGLKRS